MQNAPPVLFLQKRSHRAGAQRSLARMLRSRTLSHIRPIVVLGEPGWLADELRKHDISTWIFPFPSPRALKTRILGLEAFARKVCRELAADGIRPSATVANDHQECPFALAVARAAGNVPAIGLLRSAGMSARDFGKYDCDACGTLLCVGETLRSKVRLWAGREPRLFQEGFAEDEVHPLREIPDVFPDRILIIGTEHPAKGFTDFIEAIDLAEADQPDFPSLQCDFTSAPPAENPGLLTKSRRATFTFLGRVDDFSSCLRNYALVLHPSRAETFGMAPVESMLAGTPTLLSATGIAADSDFLTSWSFPPADPRGLADKLVQIWKSWPDCCSNLGEIQQTLQKTFSIDQTTQPMKAALAACGIT